MGIACIDFCAHVDAARHLAGSDTSSVPCRRFEHQYHYAIAAVLSARGSVLSALCKGYGNRHRNGVDVTLFADFPRYLDDIPAFVYLLWLAAWHSVELYVSITVKPVLSTQSMGADKRTEPGNIKLKEH